MIKRALLAVFFGGYLVTAGLALSPSQDAIIMLPHKNARNIHSPIPTNISLPTILGTAQVGQSLTASGGTWNNAPTSFLYQWNRAGAAIAGAAAPTYAPVAADVGSTLTVSVIAANASGASAPATSIATATVTGNPRIAGRYVFSDYLAYEYTYGAPSPSIGDANDIAAHKHDIQDAQATGIDGFQYDYYNDGGAGPLQFNIFANMLEAAKELAAANPSQPPFLLFLAPQLAGGAASGTYAGENWIQYWMEQFHAHPNYFKYNGQPVLGSFLGLDQQPALTTAFTALANEGINVFYVPSSYGSYSSQFTTNGTTMTAWAKQWIGSLHCWTGDIPANDVGCTNALEAINAANGKPNAIDVQVSTFWDTHSTGSGTYFEHFGGEGPDTEWKNVIPTNPAFVIESPWDDLTESYSSPVNIPNVPTVNSTYPYNALLKPHAGYSQIRKYYAQWYTTGIQPTISQDFVAYFYRTSPVAAQTNPCPGGANLGPCPPTYGSGVTPIDDVYVTADLVSPGTLQINTGGTITTYNLPAGRNLVHTPFTPGATQNFQIIRGGVQVATVSGEPIIANPTRNNLEWTSGFAYGQSNPPPPVPVNTALPTVSGTAQVGQTLTGTNGIWSNNPTSYRYMWTWEDCGTDNTRTAISTVPLTSDIGHQLCFSVWASNASGESVRVEAALTATVTAATAF